MTNTPNLALHTWAPEDPVNVAEVNENFLLLDQNSASIAQQFQSVAQTIGTGGHTCRIAFGSYAGTNTYGASNPCTLTFDFKPVLVIIRTDATHYETIMLRGAGKCGTCWSSGYDNILNWANRSVSWHNTQGAEYQNNAQGHTFYYVALGYSD